MKAQALAIYDNGGKTWDRYTVVIDHHVYTMSANASEPGGFNQYMDTTENLSGYGIGKKKLLEELPKQVRVAIAERMNL